MGRVTGKKEWKVEADPLVLSLLLIYTCFLSPSQAETPSSGLLQVRTSLSAEKIGGPFQVPAKLRPRVEFWKDVFTKYGKQQLVVHHRSFPQVIFGVLDFSTDAETMSPATLAAYKESVSKETVNSLRQELLELVQLGEPRTALQGRIVRAMEFLPKGNEKYKALLDDKELIRTQTGIREKFEKSIERSGKYLPVMERIFTREFGLPKELTRLPFIESSFDYTAYSSVGAAGLWQLMPRTAKALGVGVGKVVDGRRDPIAATRAAAKYLREAYNRLGAWPLAVTSYNHGVGGVLKRISQSGTSDLATMLEHPEERYFGFASSNFFPEFLAAVEIYSRRLQYFPSLRMDPVMDFVQFTLSTPISANYAAKELEISLEELEDANYALLDSIWNGRAKIPAGYALRIPIHAAGRAQRLRTGEPQDRRVGPSSSSIYGGLVYKVRKGDTLPGIAKKYGQVVSEIRRLNGLKSDKLTIGQVLVIKGKENQQASPAAVSVAPTVKKSAPVIKSAPAKPSAYKVQSGDTLGEISKKTGVSVNQLKKLNGIKGNYIKTGRALRLR